MTGINNQHVITLDLNFQGIPGAIASYLIPHTHGVVLVESGPGSTVATLQAGLSAHGYTEKDITDVLLTHIHLDHGGASGWLAQQGAKVHVHPVGAPHMINPEKLLTSAARIYGDQMHALWGDFLPVPETQLCIVEDNQVIEIDLLRFRALNTPGHASHHHAYIFEDVCFTGDIGGVRMQGTKHLRIPMPPPEFNLEEWQTSLRRLLEEYRSGYFNWIAPTHFGLFSDPGWHLESGLENLKDINAWLERIMPNKPGDEELMQSLQGLTRQRTIEQGVPVTDLPAYEAANPTWMSVAGIQRYWRKYRLPPANSS